MTTARPCAETWHNMPMPASHRLICRLGNGANGRGAARHPYRVERPPTTALRDVRPGSVFHLVCPDSAGEPAPPLPRGVRGHKRPDTALRPGDAGPRQTPAFARAGSAGPWLGVQEGGGSKNKPDGRFAFQFNGTALGFRARQRVPMGPSPPLIQRCAVGPQMVKLRGEVAGDGRYEWGSV